MALPVTAGRTAWSPLVVFFRFLCFFITPPPSMQSTWHLECLCPCDYGEPPADDQKLFPAGQRKVRSLYAAYGRSPALFRWHWYWKDGVPREWASYSNPCTGIKEYWLFKRQHGIAARPFTFASYRWYANGECYLASSLCLPAYFSLPISGQIIDAFLPA